MAARISNSSLPRVAWKASAAPWKVVIMLAGRPMSCSALRDGIHRIPERRARGEVEGDGGRRELPEVIDRQRRGRSDTLTSADQRHLAADRGRRGQVDRAERLERVHQRVVRLQDHAVLVRLGEDGRDDALAEGVVERVVDRRRRDAEARRRCRDRS